MAEVHKTIEEIFAEVSTDEPFDRLRSFGFWNSVKLAKKDWDTIPRNGLDVDFVTNSSGQVDRITLRLNDSWHQIMDRSLKRDS